MRLTTLLLALGLALLCMTTFVVGQEDATTPEPTLETPVEDKPNPWKPGKLSGLAIGENTAVPVPTSILLAIFCAFIGAIGYGVFMILNSDKERERKAEEAKAKREAKNAKKGSKKKN